MLNCELDVEKRLTAQIARDGIRVKEFFIDFDRLRKGHVGEAAVSEASLYSAYLTFYWPIVQNLSGNSGIQIHRTRNSITDTEVQNPRHNRPD